MTRGEFLRELQEYYGAFKNRAVARAFGGELESVREEDFEPLLRHIYRTREPGWDISVKTIADARKDLKLDPPERPPPKCPRCGKTLAGGACVNRACPSNAGCVLPFDVEEFFRGIEAARSKALPEAYGK